MSAPAAPHLLKAILLLTCSAFLFSVMGVCIRYASATVDNATVVFFRNFVGLFIFLPFIFNKGIVFFKTEKLWMHTWRAVVGLTAMYGFFYAIAHLKLSNAMVFTYSSPIFIPLIAWLFLKEKITPSMLVAALIGFVGVTVRALTKTESPEKIVFYFCFIGTLISVIPMFWLWRPYTLTELSYLITAGILANFSQLFMSNAYKLAPAGQIGPVNYVAIFFAGMWGFLFWQEVPDLYSVIGLGLIFCAILLCSPILQKRLNSSKI